MEKITSTIQLVERIRLLEIQQKDEKLLLKEQFNITYDGLKPSSLIKNTIKDIIATPDLKNHMLSTIVGIALGYISKKVVVGESKQPIKQILGTLLQMGITKLVSSKSEGAITGVVNVIKNVLSKKKSST